ATAASQMAPMATSTPTSGTAPRKSRGMNSATRPTPSDRVTNRARRAPGYGTSAAAHTPAIIGPAITERTTPRIPPNNGPTRTNDQASPSPASSGKARKARTTRVPTPAPPPTQATMTRHSTWPKTAPRPTVGTVPDTAAAGGGGGGGGGGGAPVGAGPGASQRVPSHTCPVAGWTHACPSHTASPACSFIG